MARPPRRLLIAVASIAATSLALALAALPARAQNAAAEALFTEGEQLLASGKVGEACDAFAASNRLEPRAGTLINLGLCREQNRQLASAWVAFKDALTRVKDPKKKKVAVDKVATLEPRLSYLTISVPDESRVEGLVVTRNGQVVDPALLNRAVPVDGGPYTIAGRAPGHEEWTTTVEVAAERDKVSVDVPRFKELAALVGPTGPTGPTETNSPAPDVAAPSRFTGRRKLALAVGATGLVAIGVGAALGVSARGLEDDAFALCPDPAMTCAEADRANDLIDQGQRRAVLANVGYGVGAAALIGGAVLWLTGGPAERTSAVALTPRLGTTPGLDVLVRW